jgi:hypothetical protein
VKQDIRLIYIHVYLLTREEGEDEDRLVCFRQYCNP